MLSVAVARRLKTARFGSLPGAANSVKAASQSFSACVATL
jgi:hypothetical protein